MPYGFSKNRRYYKRYNSKLSARKVFSKRSAKAQASQIYSLSRKINRIAKANKPEIKVITSTPFEQDFDSSSLSKIWMTWVPPVPSQGTTDKSRIGTFVRCKSLTAYFSMEYYNSSTTGYHNTESAGCTARLILYQWKKTQDSTNQAAITDIGNFFEYASNAGSSYTMLCNCPFKTGISEKIHILADRKVILTTNKNQVNYKIRVKPDNLKFDANSTTLHNQIFGVIVVSGLHYDTDYTEHLQVSAMAKLVYTDA